MHATPMETKRHPRNSFAYLTHNYALTRNQNFRLLRTCELCLHLPCRRWASRARAHSQTTSRHAGTGPRSCCSATRFTILFCWVRSVNCALRIPHGLLSELPLCSGHVGDRVHLRGNGGGRTLVPGHQWRGPNPHHRLLPRTGTVLSTTVGLLTWLYLRSSWFMRRYEYTYRLDLLETVISSIHHLNVTMQLPKYYTEMLAKKPVMLKVNTATPPRGSAHPPLEAVRVFSSRVLWSWFFCWFWSCKHACPCPRGEFTNTFSVVMVQV